MKSGRNADKVILIGVDVRQYLQYMKAEIGAISYNDVIKYLIDVEREKTKPIVNKSNDPEVSK